MALGQIIVYWQFFDLEKRPQSFLYLLSIPCQPSWDVQFCSSPLFPPKNRLELVGQTVAISVKLWQSFCDEVLVRIRECARMDVNNPIVWRIVRRW